MEDPLTTIETLGPTPSPCTCAIPWSTSTRAERRAVGTAGRRCVDFKAIIAKVTNSAPVAVYIKPITGRPPQVLTYYEPEFWKLYPKARASDLARFMGLAKSGRPYERTMVIGDVPGGPRPAPEVEAALRFQQRDHLERSVDYGKKTLRLGRR